MRQLEGPDEGIEWLHALEREWRPTAMRLLGNGDSRGLGLRPRPPLCQFHRSRKTC